MPLVLNRAATVYLIAFLLFCVGIWAVLSLGSAYATAPPDLSGSWHSQDKGPDRTFAIKQSGRFIQLQFAGQDDRLDLLLTHPATSQSPLVLTGDGWQIAVSNLTASAADFSFSSPTRRADASPMTFHFQREDSNTANASR
jgi:hypothetical protein